jgi:hypothetical protein
MGETVRITIGGGETVEARAPVILSASRSTDIPAFHARWFVNRLKAGYAVWRNPFSGQRMYVSFQNCRGVVFWSKHPAPLIPLLGELDDRGIHYYFLFTLNDYGKEGFEPGVPPLQTRVGTFRELSRRIGRERVVWRFDPLIVSPSLPPRDLLERVRRTGDRLMGCTDRLVFSFIDINGYAKVRANLPRDMAEPTAGQMTGIAAGLAGIRNRWAEEGWRVSLATCAEGIDLEPYGIGRNRCIDSELMKRHFASDRKLMHYLSCGRLPEDTALFAGDPAACPLAPEKLKDRGQRAMCGCMTAKDIGAYDTCPHHCLYCYANTSKARVEKNCLLCRDDSEGLLPL